MRIIVVQTAFLGDLILSTPLLRELRRACPRARIEVVTSPTGQEVFAGLPWVDHVHLHRKRPSLTSLMDGWSLGRQLRAGGVDVAIAAHRSHRSGLLVRLCAARRRIGFADAPGAWAYTERVRRDARRHAVDRYLALAIPLGGIVERAERRPELRFGEAASRRVERLLAAEGVEADEPLLCLAPGSVWSTKRWLPDGFAAVADQAQRWGLRPLLVGSTAEVPLCRAVAARGSGGIRVLTGRTGVAELAALLARARALVSNDSGAAHAAAAVGTPVVAIFGPTAPELGYTPVGGRHRIVERPELECRPCHRHGARRCPLGHFRCMREIAPRDVLARLEEVLRLSASGAQVVPLRRPG